MSQVNRSRGSLAIGWALLAVLAVGCSEKNGAPFDSDAGHPDDYVTSHPAAYQVSGADACTGCHGGDLLGGIAKVSCYSTSRDGQSCHPGGPGDHPAGWRTAHTATDPATAATCAPCHDNAANSLSPDCFNNSLCHGAKSQHPSNWLSSHTSTNPDQAAVCAGCHQSKPGTPGCFNNTLCHGAKGSPHPPDWKDGHEETSPSQAAVCAECHQSKPGTPGCFNYTLCHGPKDD